MPKSNEILKIDKSLPKLILPENKLNMFLDWWNADIRFEKHIPHSFNEGYFYIEFPLTDLNEIAEKMKPYIKLIARHTHMTYRNIETQFVEFVTNHRRPIIWFKFIKDNTIITKTYGQDGCILSNGYIEFGDSSDAEPQLTMEELLFPKFESADLNDDDKDNIADKYASALNIHNIYLLSTCLWYIATTTKTTKYIYNQPYTKITHRSKKHTVEVQSTKIMNTPIYDFKKIRTVNVTSLQTRKQGWTYSHSFQVHGHYRHYKSGKVVFIEPYIKGKDKEFKAQEIIINPSE